MPVHNADIAAVFEEMADLLEIQDANPFRVRAYRNAARTVAAIGRDAREMLAKGQDLTELPGIGADLAGKIAEICETGTCALHAELRGQLPPAITQLLHIPGLGPKRVKALHDALQVRTVAGLKRAAQQGRIRELPGFGERTEAAILDALQTRARKKPRHRLATAAQYADGLVRWLQAAPDVDQVAVAGSLRRMRETVGDLDLLVTVAGGATAGTAAAQAAGVMQRLAGYDEVAEVLARGPTKASVRLRSGMQVDVRVVPARSFGAALHYFTGSKAHNIAIRRLGLQAGLKINEYGVFRDKTRLGGRDEAEVFAAVGLPWIPPELRENDGEIEAAREGRLPRLVQVADLRGDLHSHTTATDGTASLAAMAAAARAHGLTYLAITEHSQRLAMTRGLGPAQLRAQMRQIDALNEKLDGIVLLKGIEVDILDDGALDLPDDVLAELDVVVAAVHGKFDLPPDVQTARILAAISHPCVHVLAHPSGRKLDRRPAMAFDLEQVLRRAAEVGCHVELDCHPERLDLDDAGCRLAKSLGVLVSIDSDAHRVDDFANLRHGVGQARRGWLEPEDVLNTRTLPQLRKLLKPGRPVKRGRPLKRPATTAKPRCGAESPRLSLPRRLGNS